MANQLNEWDEVLPFEKNPHNSAKIFVPEKKKKEKSIAVDEEEDEMFNSNAFRARLDATIAAAREMKKAALWIEVPMSRAGLIEQMTEFKFHHAEGHIANLYLWLDDDIECKIPTFATHQVGVGAIVVNSRNEILCVREIRNNYRRWKIPGGLSELGEQLDEAAIREVLEETGISCRFRSVVGVRHTHGMQFGRSDLYFVVRLEPIVEKDESSGGEGIIPKPTPQEGEIEAVEWLPMEAYLEMVNAPDGHPMMQHMMKLHEQDWTDHDIQRTILKSIVPGRKPSPVYHAPLKTMEVLDEKK